MEIKPITFDYGKLTLLSFNMLQNKPELTRFFFPADKTTAHAHKLRCGSMLLHQGVVGSRIRSVTKGTRYAN